MTDGGWDSSDPGDIARQMRRKAGPFWRRFGKWLVLAIVAIVIAATSYYQIEPDEVGLVTRFGRYTRTTQPGPHFKLPLGIEDVIKVPVERQLKQEFGFRTVKADVKSRYARPDKAKSEALMLTGDLNVVDVEWIIQYQIQDPFKYVFKVRNVENTLRDISQASMRQVVGDHSVTEVLTIGREKIQIAAKKKLQQLCDHYDTGIEVLQLVLQDVNPPKPVRASFNEVNEAIQERERFINEAGAEYNRIIPKARGEAKQTIQKAEGYATQRVNNAQGDTKRFLALQEEYAKAPEVTRTRLYLETLAEVLPKSERRIVVDADAQGVLKLLPLGKEGPGSLSGKGGSQ